MPDSLTLQPQTDRQYWSFAEGPWQEDDQGVITAPENISEGNFAIYTHQAYGDFEAQYEFRWDCVWTDAGFVFRGKDALHFYMVQFPCVGQQYRAENFWAAISKVDGTSFAQLFELQMVHGISSAPQVWHHARIKVQGNAFHLWVDGRPFPVVIDDTFAEPGYVGLYTQSGLGPTAKSSFRNVSITGQPQAAASWDDGPKFGPTYSVIEAEHGHGCGNIVRAANGNLLLGVAGGICRSKDNGRTWGQAEKTLAEGTLHVAKNGQLSLFTIPYEPPFTIQRAISDDHGQTWSKEQQVGEIKFGPERPYSEYVPNKLLALKNGSLVWFAYVRTTHEQTIFEGRRYRPGPIPNFLNICIHSDDDGLTWSDWINIDGPPYDNRHWMIYKDDVSEVSATETLNGDIVTLARPYNSPVMWESWSKDGGRTWTPQARGPFALFACTGAMVTTASGYLLIGGRFPAMSVQVSRDHGMSWQCYQVDNGIWANGTMFEVEPDVVLFIYGSKDNPDELRCQRLRVTENNLIPLDS